MNNDGKPIQYASGYSLDVYCCNSGYDVRNHKGQHSEQYSGENFRECAAQARRDGWRIFTKTRTAMCPTCAKSETAKKA